MALSEIYLLCVPWKALAGAVGAFEPLAFAQPLQTLFGDDVAAGHHHRGVLLSALFFADWADKDRMVSHRPRQGYFDGQLVLRRPLCPLLLHDIRQFQ